LDDPLLMTRDEFKLQYEYARRCYCEMCTKRRVLHFYDGKAVCYDCACWVEKESKKADSQK